MRAHSTVATVTPARIGTPPIVGVPTLFSRWLSGPSDRMI